MVLTLHPLPNFSQIHPSFPTCPTSCLFIFLTHLPSPLDAAHVLMDVRPSGMVDRPEFTTSERIDSLP